MSRVFMKRDSGDFFRMMMHTISSGGLTSLQDIAPLIEHSIIYSERPTTTPSIRSRGW